MIHHRTRRTARGIAAALITAAAALDARCLAAGGAPATEGHRRLEDTPRLTVRGGAELHRPADQIALRIGVVTENADAARALSENNRRMREVVKGIEAAGITKDEYETGRFRIRPQYSRRPRQPEADWRRRIVGYEVANDIVVRTKRMELAGDLIGRANDAGANSVDVMGFSLADPRTHRAEAIAQATRNAIADARSLAGAASLRLVRIVNIALDQAPMPRPETAMARMAMATDTSGGPPPITPGNVTVRAGVTIVYEIAPAGADH